MVFELSSLIRVCPSPCSLQPQTCASEKERTPEQGHQAPLAPENSHTAFPAPSADPARLTWAGLLRALSRGNIRSRHLVHLAFTYSRSQNTLSSPRRLAEPYSRPRRSADFSVKPALMSQAETMASPSGPAVADRSPFPTWFETP